MTKIALLCNGYGKVFRGAERFAEEFYTHLRDIFDIDIYGIGKTDHSIQIKSKFRDDIKLPTRRMKAYYESYLFGKGWYNYTKNNEYDVVINNAGFGGSYWCRKYRRKTHTPFITRARGGGNIEERINLLYRPDVMVFLTESNLEHANIDFLNAETIVIPNGIDIHPSKDKIDELDELKRPLFISTSALVGYKRVDLIIKAVKKYGRGSLVIAGDGDKRKELITLAERELGNRFGYLGVLDRERVNNLYNSGDVFVLASEREGFGVSYLEAMAHNIPVVTQRDSRRRKIVGNAGIFVDCNDIEEFSKGLKRAVEIDWGKKPIQQAKKYSWDKIKERWVALIETVSKQSSVDTPHE